VDLQEAVGLEHSHKRNRRQNIQNQISLKIVMSNSFNRHYFPLIIIIIGNQKP
jgi:hypothetical protein